MRNLLLHIILFPLLASISFAQRVDEINLAGVCAFKPGDDETWRSKYIDERESWNFIKAPGAWERIGYPSLDGFAWYRFRFQIPASMKEDSLVLIIDAIDDVDQTFLNGWLVGQTGSFPPNPRSECKTLRIYPLPRRAREEFNLLAIRVFDIADSGGIDGSTIKIVRASNLGNALNSLPKEPFHSSPLFISNGECLATFNPSTNSIESFFPHLFHEIEPDLITESALKKLTVGMVLNGTHISIDTLNALQTEFYHNTNIIHQLYDERIELFWYIPHVRDKKILIILLQYPKSLDLDNIALSLTVIKPAFAYREIKKEIGASKRHYFILSYNSCCREFAERDMEKFLQKHTTQLFDAEDIENEMMYWGEVRAKLQVPQKLSEEEASIFRQSATILLDAQVQESGSGQGQIVSAFQPANKKYCYPLGHLLSTSALASAGLISQAMEGMNFIMRTNPNAYIFYDVYGDEHGIGIPYQITPAKYLGNGAEFMPKKKENGVLSYAGTGSFFQALNSIMFQRKRIDAHSGKILLDSTMLASDWNIISRKIADVLMEVLDSTHLVRNDAGPWGQSLSHNYNIASSIWAAAGLKYASRFAGAMKDTLRAMIYKLESEKIVFVLDSLIHSVGSKSTVDELTPLELIVFDPLLVDAINLGVIYAQSRSAALIMDIAERSFKIKDQKNSFLAKPNGDWFERQERPYIALIMASAYAKIGNVDRAEELFAHCVDIASKNYGMLPELRDPLTGNWYGGVPSIGWGAAAYIQTAIAISEMRIGQSRSRLNNN